MQYENLSKHSAHFRIACDSLEGKEYWVGNGDWVKNPDSDDITVLRYKRALEYLDRLHKCGVNAYLEPVVTDIQLIHWKGFGWVVFSAVTGKVHDVKFINSRGQGWYIKDVGTIEQTLCINYSKDAYADVLIRGDQIGEVTYYVNGTVMEDFGSFSINTDSNLLYQFEISVEPVPEDRM